MIEQQVVRERIAEALNALPFVLWDRLVSNEQIVQVYGWIARPDGRHDFVLVEFWDAAANVGFTTSSADYSAEISERLCGDAGEHVPCRRVEDVFEDAVEHCTQLRIGETA